MGSKKGLTRYSEPQQGLRYECIYKNLIRDLRLFFFSKFKAYQKSTMNENRRDRHHRFPFLVLMLIDEFFDKLIIEGLFQTSGKDTKICLRQIAFTLGSFIDPKLSIIIL